MDEQTYAKRLARLAVEVGANVQPDQIVAVAYAPGMEPIVHELARLAYERGAKLACAHSACANFHRPRGRDRRGFRGLLQV